MGHGQDHPVAEGGQARHYRHLTSLRGLAIAFLLAAAALVARPAAAVAAFYAPRMATILIDARTGAVLEQHNADAPRYPASLTKLMTLYMLFEALRDHRVTLGEQVPVTWHAASMEPVKLYIKPGMRFTVQQAILGMVTLSANDAASAIGQMLGGGSEWRFGQMMTLKAHALGMWHTAYRNASGLPNPAQITTARDVATLARRLISDFPGDYRYFSTPYFRFNGRTIYTDDVLLKSYPGVDGMKTGYTDAAGHNLVTSALRGGVRLIGVVLDAPSNLARNETMVALLNRGFTEEGVLRGGMVVARAAPLARPATPVVRPVLARATAPVITQARKAAAHAAIVGAELPRRAVASSNWSLQLGNFLNLAYARKIAFDALHNAGGGIAHVDPVAVGGKRMWHAYVLNLTPAQANLSCNVLRRYKVSCSTTHPATNEVAER